MKTTSKSLNQKLIILQKCLRTLIKGSLLLLTSFIIVSCSTTQVSPDKANQGEWEARVLVKNKKNKTFLVNVDFFATRDNQLRMDITTPVGMHVASVALDNQNMTYVIPQKKAYYNGPGTTQAFTKTLNVAIDPSIISNILFDLPVEQKGWTCKKEEEVVSQCIGKGMKIVWSNRKSKEKTVVVTHSQYQLQLKFHNFRVPNSLKDGIFSIAQPKGFTKLN